VRITVDVIREGKMAASFRLVNELDVFMDSVQVVEEVGQLDYMTGW
jgi:hypothetical protein